MKNYLGLLLLILCLQVYAQNKPVIVVEEKDRNRLAFYAHNEDDKDYDVFFEVKGSNFRQSAAKPRWIRVPSTSRVHLKTIILLRDKQALYKHSLKINDSLSRRALKKESTPIVVPPRPITPKKHITIYVTAACQGCDAIISQLNTNLYIFRSVKLAEKPNVKAYLSQTLNSAITPLDSVQTPIVNLGGNLYTWIKDYETLLQELEKD